MSRTVEREKTPSLEEKLKGVLIPEAAQPYRVPKNWCWIHLLDSFENQTDSKKKIQQKDYLEQGNISIVDQGQSTVGGYTDDTTMAFSGALPVIVFGDHTRCIKYIDFPFAQGADGIKVLVPKRFFVPKAFYYALQSIDIPNMGYRRHYPLFKNYCIPLPPIPEQQRIVGRIDSFFDRLDEAEEKVASVIGDYSGKNVTLGNIEQMKKSILARAFRGELGTNDPADDSSMELLKRIL